APLRLWRHRLQGAVPLPRLPRAFRALQAAMSVGLHFHPLRVRALQRDTDDAVIVSFDTPHELAEIFRFDHGQYLTLRCDVDGQDLRRSYSICAGVDDGELRVGVRRVPGGVFSAWVHERLQPGDTLQVIPPQGHFTLPLDANA